MLRSIFVLGLIALGVRHALRGPFYAVLFYLWVAYFRPQEWVWEGAVRDLNLSLIVGVYAVLIGFGSGQAFKVSGRLLVLLLFMLDTLISTMASPYSAYAWVYWIDWFKAAVITYLLVVLTDDVSKLRLVFLTIALSLGFESAKQGWGQLIFAPGAKNFNGIEFLGDNNGVAIGMFMLVPMLVALYQTTTQKWAKRGFVFLLVGVIYRGISTYSRGGFLTCAAILGMTILRAKRKFLAFSAVGALALVLAPILSQQFYDRMSTITFDVSTVDVSDVSKMDADTLSTVGRLHFWHTAWQMIQDRPILGVGHNSFVAAYDNYDDLNGIYGRNRSVHNSWLGLASELGIPGLLIFLVLYISGLVTCQRIRRLGKSNERIAELVPYATAVQTSLIAFAIGGTFVIFQYTEMLWHFIGLTIVLQRLALNFAAQPVPSRVVARAPRPVVPNRGWA